MCPQLRQLCRCSCYKSIIWNVSWHCGCQLLPSSASLCSACCSVSAVSLTIHTGQSKTLSVVVNWQTSFRFSKQLMNCSLRLSLWSGQQIPEPCEVVQGYWLLLHRPSCMYLFRSPFLPLLKCHFVFFVLILWNSLTTEISSQQRDCQDSELKQCLIFSLVKY